METATASAAIVEEARRDHRVPTPGALGRPIWGLAAEDNPVYLRLLGGLLSK